MNPQTGRRKVRIRSSISFGTIIFWAFLGWMWFGDTITEVFHEITKTAVVATVDGEKTVIDVDKLIDNAVKKAESLIESEKKPEPEPEPTKDKEMVAEKNEDDLYGNTDDKW